MEPFRHIEHTGDIGVEVFGESPAALFQNAATAFFTIVAEGPVEPKETKSFRLEAHDMEQLLVTWLSEFLFLFDTRRLLFSEFKVHDWNERFLSAEARGETFDPKKHKLITEIKAVTYHGLKIKRKDGIYTAQIIFDI